MEIIDADRIATEYQANLDEEITKNLAVLRKRKSQIQAKESAKLLSVPGELIDDLAKLCLSQGT